MNQNRSIIAAGALLCAAGLAHAGPFTDWNLVVAGDLAMSTSEVDGSALIGGSLLGGTSNYSIQGVTASNNAGLAVAGVLESGVTVNINNGGDFRIADTANQLGTVNTNGGTTVHDPTLGAQVGDIITRATAISQHFSTLTPTGGIDGGGNLSSPALTTIDGQSVAVYSISQSQVNGLGQLNLNFGAADAVIINYTTGGTGVANLNAPPNLVGGFNQANSSRILWNFADASEITINNNFNGALLAPGAALSLTGGGINGSVIVDSFAVQSTEVRLNLYTGPVPAPGAAGLLACGLLITRRRRR